ncbi:MAG: amidohydrolase family protein [Nitrospirota bacterium]
MIIEDLIDLHTHGISGYDTQTDKPETILKIAELHGKAGTGAILPTIYSGPIDLMRKNMEAVRKAMGLQSSRSKAQGCFNGQITAHFKLNASRILGVHLEGPFLNPSRCGALDKKSFLKPSMSSLSKLITGYEDVIGIITIAPEIPGALKIIETCSGKGIKVNMGHSDATYKQALDGKKAGASGVTHIFNAMRPFHHRDPGLACLGLLDEDLYIEVIADGIHLHPETLEIIFRIKRLDRIILVSDSVKGPKTVKGALFNNKGALRGSSITLSDSVEVLKKIGIPDAGIAEAAKDNPARYIS